MEQERMTTEEKLMRALKNEAAVSQTIIRSTQVRCLVRVLARALDELQAQQLAAMAKALEETK